jgi:hypothetical protein
VRDSSGDLSIYHQQFVRQSGLSESQSVAHIHFVLCEVLRLAITVDQLDITNLQSFELLVRRVIQDEVAVSRNAKHPDYGGLEVVMSAPVSESGAAVTMVFQEWVMNRLKDQANVHKQTRLWSEEQRLRSKGAGRGKGKDDADGSAGGAGRGGKSQPTKKGKNDSE